MKKITTLVTAVKTALENNLPALLSAAGVSNFDSYLKYYIDDPDKKICAVFPFAKTDNEERGDASVLIKCQLPGVMNDLEKYIDVLDVYIESLEAYDFDNYTSLDKTMLIDYPGNSGGAYAGAEINFELDFYSDKDSCD